MYVRLLLALGTLVHSPLGLSDSKKAETFWPAELASQAPLREFGGAFSKNFIFLLSYVREMQSGLYRNVLVPSPAHKLPVPVSSTVLHPQISLGNSSY